MIFAARQWRRSPGWCVLAVGTLALAIGLVTVMFGVVDATLLRPFPYRDPQRLALLWGSKSLAQMPGVGLDVRRWRESSAALEDVDVFLGDMRAALGPESTDTVRAACIGRRILPILGVEPLLGRHFDDAETQRGGAAVVMLSHALWRSRYGSDRAIVGRAIRVDGRPRTVVGVMPERFFFPDVDVRLWLPTPCGPAESEMHALGRLSAGGSFVAAQAELDAANAVAPDSGAARRQTGIFPLHRVVVAGFERAVSTLLAGAGLVLLLACANVAHLQLSRGLGRQTELAIRSAAGASRARLMRLMLTESALLAAGAAAVGLLVAGGGFRLLRVADLADIPRLDAAALDARVVVAAIAASAFTTIASGLWPAWKASRRHADEVLRLGWGATPLPRRQARDLLTVTEVSLAVALLVVTGLVVRSFVEISRADWGFEPAGLLLTEVRTPAAASRDAAAAREWRRLVVERLRHAPGVAAASHGSGVPLRWLAWWPTPVSVDGRPSNIVAGVWTVGSDFLTTAGIRMIRGRDFTDADDELAPRRIVVSRAFAEQAWPGADPIGRRIQLLELRPEARERYERERASFRGTWDVNLMQAIEGWSWEVIGLVENVRTFGLQIGSNPGIYVTEAQLPRSMRRAFAVTPFIIRTNGRDQAVAAGARSAILAADRGAELADMVWVEDLVAQSIGGRGSNRLMLLVSVVFGVLALTFAATGVYGIVALDVSERREEFAIRAAVGAGRRDIAHAALVHVGRLMAGGLALGLTAAWAATRGMGALLYEISPADPVSYAAAAATLAAAAGLACVPPLRRALSSDPIAALRM